MRYSPMLKLSHTSGLRLLGAALVCVGYAALTACTSADSDLARFIEDTKKEPGGHMFGLVQTKDGLVHRVTAGNHLGQAEGKITDITPAKISLIEIVPDSLGGYMERPAALALNE